MRETIFSREKFSSPRETIFSRVKFLSLKEKSSQKKSSQKKNIMILVRATNSKLLGTKILELSKTFRVELENT